MLIQIFDTTYKAEKEALEKLLSDLEIEDVKVCTAAACSASAITQHHWVTVTYKDKK